MTKGNAKGQYRDGSILYNIANYFDRQGGPWISAYSQMRGPWYKRWYEYNIYQLRERYALSLIKEEPKGAAVDLGCGAGHALIQMKRMGFNRVIGIDISDRMLEAAREVARVHGLTDSIRLLKGDVQNLDMIESGSVDACTALGVIEYLDEDGPLLREVNRILREGGAAVIQTRNRQCIRTRSRALIQSITGGGGATIAAREHRPSEFRATASMFGFRVEGELYFHFYALYPLDIIPVVRRAIGPFNNWLSKACERLAAYPFSRYLASGYMVRIRKISDLQG